MKIIKGLGGFVFLLLSVLSVQAQKENLDKVAAIVGDKIILKSELESAIAEMQAGGEVNEDSLRCAILENAMSQKMLTEQADRDSVMVSDEEVEGALDNRIRYFISQYGSEEKLEEIAGKSVYQIKDENRTVYREQLQFQKMQQQLMAGVKITPQEVKAFYNKIPADSLPFYPSTLEIGQIVFHPQVNQEVEDSARAKLERIRNEIVTGKSTFEVMAGVYSDDPGSRDNGGDLGIMGREDLVPEFASAAFRLQNGEISPVVKTSYGLHIVQMMHRQGEKAKLRHILVKPLITADMIKLSLLKADSVRAELISGKLPFTSAVAKYSDDESSKLSGGMITNPQTGSSSLLNEDLDPAMAMVINDLQVGAYSQPQEYTDSRTGDKLVRILYLKSRTEPHKAN
ncbi:MAG TPA: peptidylprolyl isomerase, partial [Chitinophagaceae bacterium]|nr:peptidylprolyl isomerase [Chitinophagaceae bacterium]